MKSRKNMSWCVNEYLHISLSNKNTCLQIHHELTALRSCLVGSAPRIMEQRDKATTEAAAFRS